MPEDLEDEEEMVTLRILDEKTGEELSRDEVPRSVIERIDRIAGYYGISPEEVYGMIMTSALNIIEEATKDLEKDPMLKARVLRMFGEALHEVLSPSWKPPEGMIIEGNAPPEAVAECIVKMRLHMSEHNS